MIEYDDVKELVRIAEQLQTMEAPFTYTNEDAENAAETGAFLMMLATKLGYQDWYEG